MISQFIKQQRLWLRTKAALRTHYLPLVHCLCTRKVRVRYQNCTLHTFLSCPTFLLLSSQVPAAISAPPQTTIFIPGRGAVLQAMASLPFRPPVPIPSSVPALAPGALRPPQPPVPGSVRCSGCSKVRLITDMCITEEELSH